MMENAGVERSVVLGAAGHLLRLVLTEADGTRRMRVWLDAPEESERRMKVVEDRAREAVAELRSYRESRGFRLALDSVLPGWFDIDPSDYFTFTAGDFVSNDPVEWHDYLVGRGMSSDQAKELLAREGHPVPTADGEGASR